MRILLARIWQWPTGRLGLMCVALILLVALLAPVIAPYGPNAIDVKNRLQGPSFTHWLGTDHLGRDLLSRVMDGTRVAVLVSIAVIAIAATIGLLLGMIAALAPRRIERIVLVIFDIISAFPSTILALALIALFGTGVANLVLLVSLAFVPQFGRIARAQTLAIRNAPFIEAERVLGASHGRIVLSHVLPNILGPVFVLASMNIPVVITIEAGLSFLGIGVPPPLASWGSMLRDGYTYLNQSVWPTIGAAGALTLATLGSTLFGEALRDATDPKLQGVS
ncbi:MAG: ABC transporter permease [Hyphomicrobiaceae bacterium]